MKKIYLTFTDPSNELESVIFIDEISYITKYTFGSDDRMRSSMVMRNGHVNNTKYTVKELLDMIKKAIET